MNNISEYKERCIVEYFYELEKIKSHTPTSVQKIITSINKKVVDNFYVTYPFFFHSFYEDINEEKIFSLAKCGNLFMTYILILDNTLDQDNQSDNSTIISLHYLHKTAIAELYKLFPPNSLFWTFYSKYENDFFSTDFRLKKTKLKNNNPPIFEDFIKDIVKRNSFAKCTTAGLLTLNPNVKSDIDPFVLTQDYFHIGLQLLDDLEDWRDDFKKGRSSYVLAKSFSDPILLNALKTNVNKTAILGKYIYYSGLATNIFDLAISNFEKSLYSSSQYRVPNWNTFLEKFIIKTQKQRDEISSLVERKLIIKKIHSLSFKIPPLSRSLDDKLNYKFIKSALKYINIELESNFVEMEHILELPDFSSGINPKRGQTIVGKLFQRTLVLDLFFELNNLQKNLIPEKIIDNEIEYILDSKMKNVKGGWNYFPSYKYLPPDTDDLAQVIQVLVKSSQNNINQFVDVAIDLLLTHNMYKNNTFKTWILDPNSTHPLQKLHEATIENYWGNFHGKDIEVSANMLYALAVYNKNKYSTIISKGIDSILSFQNNDGTWSSIWYWDNFYGTYVVVRLLSYLDARIDALKLTAKYLEENQNKDGGWGHKESNPISTALSILILLDIKNTSLEIGDDVFKQSVNYLVKCQKKSGDWSNVPFIKMKVGGKYVSYESSTITTVFVLKAFCSLISSNIKLSI